MHALVEDREKILINLFEFLSVLDDLIHYKFLGCERFEWRHQNTKIFLWDWLIAF